MGMSADKKESGLFMMLLRYVVLVAALVAAAVAAFAQPPDLPHIEPDTCPFEGCVFREWKVIRRVVAYESREVRTPVFAVEPGEVVTALTGDVVTTTPGKALRYSDGAEVHLLVPHGEGIYTVWSNGSKGKADIGWYKPPDYPGCARNNSCQGEVFSYPKYTWWVQIRNAKGQVGWTDQTRDLDCKNAISTCRDDLEPARNRR
jgi:hypothetical protein